MDTTNSDYFESFIGPLGALGYDERVALAAAKLAGDEEELIPARIGAVHRDRYEAFARSPEGAFAEAHLRITGNLGQADILPAERPAVGDWVIFRAVPGLDGREGLAGVIKAVLPRKGAFVRKEAGLRQDAQVMAANVDLALIVAAAGHDFNPRRLERYLTLAWESGAQPLVVITKIDLAEDPETLFTETLALCPGSDAVLTSARDGTGIAELSGHLRPGKTSVLLGSSGAGKSTLLNALAGRELAATGEVREDDQRGRHTTTRRELFVLDSGALVVDTPGLRELQLWADAEAVDSVFADIEELALACRFRDCSHRKEPGCAVRAALEEGSLDAKRYAGWVKLRREVAWLARREDPTLQNDERNRWRAIHQSMRGWTKESRSLGS